MTHYYGEQTAMALDNFPFPVPRVSLKLIYGITQVKKAAARANCHLGHLNKARHDAIVQASDEILAGKYDNQFVTPYLQGGAGTSINMNVNEVIAHRASEILSGHDVHQTVDPNDHVNMSQSTNDANPTGLRIAAVPLLNDLMDKLEGLEQALTQKSRDYNDVRRLARTHMQDAVPTTYGATFAAYGATVKRNAHRLAQLLPYLYELNIGGTAIGNGINAPRGYKKKIIEELKGITGLPVKPADNPIAQTGGAGDWCHLMGVITVCALDISKMSNDLRFLASGPRGGINEILLKPLQPGSSIMPGKVNPVMPESMNQIYYSISGKSHTVHQAAEASHLELAVMFPVIADAVIFSLELLGAGVQAFAETCIKPIRLNEAAVAANLEASTAYATLFSPATGYGTMSAIVKEALASGTSIPDLLAAKGIMTKEACENLIVDALSHV